MAKKATDDTWERIATNYEFVKGAQVSNSFIILMALSESKEQLSTTQISEKIAANSKGKLFKVSGALKDSPENRLRRNGYVTGVDVPQQGNKKPVRKTMYSITPKGRKLFKGWIGFLSLFLMK